MFVGCGRFSSASSIRGLGTVGADLVKTVGGCKVAQMFGIKFRAFVSVMVL